MRLDWARAEERSCGVAKPKRKNAESVHHVGVPRDASKTLAYEALAAFNRDVEQVLADLERLGALGLLPEREQHRFLKVCRATLEETRAWANFEWTNVLRQQEEREWARFARIRQREDAR
jgi:hypothetical protein